MNKNLHLTSLSYLAAPGWSLSLAWGRGGRWGWPRRGPRGTSWASQPGWLSSLETSWRKTWISGHQNSFLQPEESSWHPAFWPSWCAPRHGETETNKFLDIIGWFYGFNNMYLRRMFGEINDINIVFCLFKEFSQRLSYWLKCDRWVHILQTKYYRSYFINFVKRTSK